MPQVRAEGAAESGRPGVGGALRKGDLPPQGHSAGTQVIHLLSETWRSKGTRQENFLKFPSGLLTLWGAFCTKDSEQSRRFLKPRIL